jgi:hypothetical protein
MMRHGGLGHVELFRQRASRHLSTAQQLKDMSPGWIGEGLER